MNAEVTGLVERDARVVGVRVWQTKTSKPIW